MESIISTTDVNPDIIITEKDNGSTIVVPINSNVVVKLKWNPSTGYAWENSDISIIQLISVKQDTFNITPGASIEVSFKFHILNDGIIEMNYVRPFENEIKPIKSFSIKIKTQ